MAKKSPFGWMSKFGSDKTQTGKRNKYGAKRVGAHASKKEHHRAQELQLMQRAGLI